MLLYLDTYCCGRRKNYRLEFSLNQKIKLFFNKPQKRNVKIIFLPSKSFFSRLIFRTTKERNYISSFCKHKYMYNITTALLILNSPSSLFLNHYFRLHRHNLINITSFKCCVVALHLKISHIFHS